MKKVLQIWLDYDGCFNSANIRGTQKAWTKENGTTALILDKRQAIIFRGPIVDHIMRAIYELKPDEVEICSFSNRQDAQIDNLNNYGKSSLSSFEIYAAFAVHLQKIFTTIKITNNRFLLADTYQTKYREGYVWNESLRFLSNFNGIPFTKVAAEMVFPPQLKSTVTAHSLKIDLFYCKAHVACNNHPDALVHAIVYDDLEDALESIYTLYKERAELLPRNFSADLFAFTSITGLEKSGQEKEQAYRAQSPLDTREPAPYSERETIVLPGADTRKPEQYPYHSLTGETLFKKKALAHAHFTAEGAAPSIKDGPRLKISHPFHSAHRIFGSGMPKKDAHLLNIKLRDYFKTSAHPDESALWVRCPGSRSGIDLGAWNDSETLHDKISRIAETPYEKSTAPKASPLHARYWTALPGYIYHNAGQLPHIAPDSMLLTCLAFEKHPKPRYAPKAETII
jgi:hypothetical protein